MDLIIVRENTEGEYVGIEHEVVPGVVESLKIITEKGSTRIAKFAFQYSRDFKRKMIHAVHKANIMKMSDGLFLACARKVSRDFQEITYKESIIDATCMQLVMNPYQYDVLLMENLYGDIVSDLCAAFVGGLGLVPGANLGHECAIFEAVHGSAPDIAGKNIANPTALLQSGVLMLHHIKEHTAAERVQNALEWVYRKKKDKLTKDVGGPAGPANSLTLSSKPSTTPPRKHPTIPTQKRSQPRNEIATGPITASAACRMFEERNTSRILQGRSSRLEDRPRYNFHGYWRDHFRGQSTLSPSPSICHKIRRA